MGFRVIEVIGNGGLIAGDRLLYPSLFFENVGKVVVGGGVVRFRGDRPFVGSFSGV